MKTHAFIVLLALVGLFACKADLLGPQDPGYDDLCVYAATTDSAGVAHFTLSRASLDRCRQIEVYAVRFGSGGT